MDSLFYILVTWIRKEDMVLQETVFTMSRDTKFGQEYMYWGESYIANSYAERFDFDDEVVILGAREIEGVR